MGLDQDGKGFRYVSERHIVIDENPTPAGFWNLKRIYEDKTVLVLGGGPSHVEVDLNLLSNCRLIAVNSSCRKVMGIATEEDILYFSDNSWSEIYKGLIDAWPGLVVTSNRNTKVRLGNLVHRLDLQDLTEYMQIKSDYVQGSSGHTAVCLGIRLGAKKIILTGFECDPNPSSGKTHGHGDYSQENIHAFEERYIPGWTAMAKRFRELGCEVINSTLNSKVRDFTFVSLEQAIRDD